jgi:hypothetical protein
MSSAICGIREKVLLSLAMARPPADDSGNWNLRGIPRSLMRRVKMAAAHEGKTVKDLLMELAQARIEELERKGILPKGKG